MKIGNVEINGLGALAPMAGASDAAFRQLCREFGAAYTVTEMVSSRAMDYNDRKTMELADISHDQGPVFIQIFGSEPDCMARAAEKMAALGPAGIDINMGCPAPKIVSSGAGCALMQDPTLCGKIVSAVKKAVNLPVTVKIRAGWSWGNANAPEVAKVCQEAGADGVCIHGRSRDQFYSGKADPGIMRLVKEAVDIPVIANGDVGGPDAAEALLKETGCDMVMVGRGALGNPWVFRALNLYFSPQRQHLPPPDMEEKLRVMRLHAQRMCEYKGETRAMLEMRKHAGWYLSGLRWASRYKRQTVGLHKLEDLDLIIQGMRKMTELEQAGQLQPNGKRVNSTRTVPRIAKRKAAETGQDAPQKEEYE
ncbi:MAG: tRNA dihydrouridine synthase DusB [Acutalibacter sp.]|nr:tRNA dihydrouridine synthase DusB [Acutalibacter sp.]